MPYNQIRDQELRAALDAVLASNTFARAERLRRFLSFVCDLVLAGKSDEINEHLIGIEVFDRQAGYSPAEDSIVRRQAHALRRKLQEYYEREGRDAPIRIELPLGHYAATFRLSEDQAPSPESPAASVPRKRPFRRPLGWIAAGLLLFLSGWFSARIARPAATFSNMPASMQWLWRPWLADPSGVTLCLSTPRTVVVKYYPQPHPETPDERLIPASSPRNHTLREFFALPEGGELREYPSVGQAKMGEAVAAIRLTSLLSAHHVPVRVEPASFLEWNHARNDNLIVFGHSESTPWVDRLLAGYPIRTQASLGSLPKRITVAAPRPGERPIYSISESNPDEVYVLISMVPGLDGEHRLLAVSGLSGMATQYGAEFLTTPSHVETLERALRDQGARPGRPLFFQAVLQVDVHKNRIPLKGHIELIRIVSRPAATSVAALTVSQARGK